MAHLARRFLQLGLRLLDDWRIDSQKGEKPGDLPVQQTVKFELVVNLKRESARPRNTANIVVAADEVIE